MTEPKEYVAFADAIAALLQRNGGAVHLNIQQRSEDRGRKDTQDGITTFHYRVSYRAQEEHPQPSPDTLAGKELGFWDFSFGMDAEDKRQQTPAEELLSNLNFGLRQRGLEGVLNRTESITVRAVLDLYEVRQQQGTIVLVTPQGTQIPLPPEIQERLKREAIQWYQENGHRNAQRQV